MANSENISSTAMPYGVGALIVLVVSIGAAAVVYGLSLLAFNLFSFPTWLFGPLGVYTLAYSFIARKGSTYYLVWGSVLFAVAMISALYAAVSPFVILGILAIVIAIIGIIAYQRSKKWVEKTI
ncbi:MAG: hypothetical protein NWE94_07695 [Candidatus Bathyarchaeota archaeon]|nr:hypothetical protein [Candidatus Bathyarchaeota archaeon]